MLELATDPNSKRERNALLKWWDKYVSFLHSITVPQIKLCLAIRQVMPDVVKHKKAMRSSMAAKFKEEAARRAEARCAARRSEH